MADDVLLTKLYNFICGSGGFVELAVLLKPSSPLGSRKSKQEAKKWLISQGPNAGFVCVKNQNGEIAGVRVDLRKKVCYQYATKGDCRIRRRQGSCKYWHICKSFIEGKCEGFQCGLSHDFYNEGNWEIAEELELEKYSNGAMKNIVAWSLPQVCQLYLRNECTWSECPYLHVCAQFVEGSSCNCALSHNLSDCHNNKILKQYDLVPPSQVINVDFVRCSVLVLSYEQKRIGTGKSLGSCDTELTHKTTSKQDPNLLSNVTKAVVSNPASKQNPSSSRFPVTSPEKNQENNARVAKVLFETLCKEFNCSAPLEVLNKREGANVKIIQDMSLFLEENNDKFLFTRSVFGDIQQIIAFCPKLRLCLDFLSQKRCNKEHCPYFHLCRKFVTGSCTRGENCSRSHKFRNKRDQETLLELKLEWLTNEQLRQLMLSSTPQVCINYNTDKCTNDGTCPRVHICKDFLVNACRNGDTCRFRHKGAFDTHHTKTLLEKYRLGKTSFNNAWSTILVCEEPVNQPLSRKMPGAASLSCLPTENVSQSVNSRSDIGTPDSLTSSQSSRAKRVSVSKPSYPLDPRSPVKESPETFSSSQSSAANAWTPCFPTEWKVFECLCKEYSSSASFLDIAGRKELFPHGVESAERWFRETKGSFLITENSQRTIAQVSAFSARARLCLDYNKNGRCDKYDCTFLHICRDFVLKSCSNGVTCPLYHNFHNQRDKAFLSRIKLDQFTDQQLQKLVLCSTPRICVEYNNSTCSRGDDCNRIHMCCGYIRKCCSAEYECGLDHEGAMDTDHTQTVLKRHMLNKVGTNDVMKMILDDKLCLSGKEKRKGHIHKDKPDALICSQFLIDKCKKGIRCSKHHCSMPYHWQYKVGKLFKSAEWESFSEKDNLALEKLYCDVNVEAPVDFKPTQSTEVSSVEKERTLSRAMGHEVTIDVNNMTMSLKPRSSPHHPLIAGALRRLSTVAYLTCPSEFVVTNWKWYWKDNGNIWRMYDRDHMGRGLQGLIEQAFLDGLSQSKTSHTYKFKTSEHEYNLFFYPATSMYQVNMKIGTKRMVKRRPEKPVSHEDLEGLKWAYGDSSVRRKMESRTVKSNVPSHWSSMPPSEQYTRVTLEPSSGEFKDVEKLFRKSMNDYVVIERIDRVQNPFMWEKYCRKKENMRTLAKTNQQEVNEKKLFHGTSPDYVEAICKQNFDWRLHGKNATKYGEGSYFAVNASYSHSYAKRDGNMSQFMFLATVLAGSYTEGNSSYRRPPQKQPANPASDLYDSCVDNKLNPTIFVVFDTDQFYPEYIIKYFSAQPNPKVPTPRRATPRAKPLSSQTTRNSGILKQKLTNSNSLGTASRPSGSAVDSGYSAATVPSLGITSVNASRSSSNVGAVTNTNGSAARGGNSTVSQATSTDYISPQSRRITRLTPPASPTYPRGILKQHPTRSSGLGTASSPVAISGYPTVSQTTSTNYVSPQPRPTTTLTPPASQTYPRGILKQHPTSSRGSGRASSPVATSWYPTVSQTTPRPIPVPRPSTSQMNHQWIPKQQPTTTDNPHGTGASSSNSTPTVSNSGLTSTRQTERSQNLNTVSNAIDSTVRSDYSTRNDSSSWLTGGNLTRNSCNFGEALSPNGAASAARDDVPSNVFSSRPSTSHAYHATPSSSFSSSSYQGSQKKKKDCMIM